MPFCSKVYTAQDTGKVLQTNRQSLRSHITDLMPFGIVVTVFIGSETGTMERSARIRLEFPRDDYSFRYASLQDPFPMVYYSFTNGRDSILHDLLSDTISEIPTKVSPISVFSLEDSADSFFSKVRFVDVEPEIFEDQNTYVFKIISDEIPFCPGQSLKNVNGHLWIDSAKRHPVKMILMGTMTTLSGEDVPSSLIIDFFYDKMTLDNNQWKKVDAAIKAYTEGNEYLGEALIRTIEEEDARKFAAATR